MKNFLDKATNVHGNKYIYSDKPTTWQEKIRITCPEHGDFFQTPAKHIVRKQGCPACGKLNNRGNTGSCKWTREQIIEKCKKVHGDRYDYSSTVYINTKKPFNIRCKIHGDFFQTLGNHVNHKTGCPVCNPSIRSYPRNTKESIKNKLREGIEVDSIDSTAVILICPKHGKFEKSKTNLRNYPGCPKCSFKGYSTQQTAILNYLRTNKLNTVENYRYTSGKKELDIFLPEYNTAIEIDGIYWHSTNSPRNKKLSNSQVIKQQLEKKEFCNSSNIHLITILDVEWDKKETAVKNILGHTFNLLPKLFARTCKIKTISFKEAEVFFNAYHLQVMTVASHYYGLFHDDTLVACMSFRHRGDTWEIARYASSHKIVGGFKKLLSIFEKENCPKKLISFCDSRLFKGNIYKESGFQLEKIYPYNYLFIHKGNLYPRETFMRKNLPEEVQGLRLREAYKQLNIHTLYLPPHMKFTKVY